MTSRTLTAGYAPDHPRWAAARARATREGIEVRQIEGSGQWIASSSKRGRAYLLTVGEDGKVGCSCEAAAKYSLPCKHKAAYLLTVNSVEDGACKS